MASAVAGFMFRNYLWLAFLLSGISIGISSVLIFLFVQNITPVKDISQKAVYQANRHGESLWTILRENRLILLYILTASGYGAMYQMYNYLVPMDSGAAAWRYRSSDLWNSYQCELHYRGYIYTDIYQVIT